MSAQQLIVSVVIPCTDKKDGLLECLSSVLNQDCDFIFEILLVENNSVSRVVVSEVVASLSCDKIKHYYLDDCTNANIARNFGTNVSQAEFVAYLDSDDLWLSNHLSNGVGFFNNNKKVTAIYSGHILNDGFHEKYVSSRPILNETGYKFLFGKDPGVAQTSSYIIRRELIDQISWDEDLNRSQDYDFFVSVQREFGWGYNPAMTSVVIWKLGERREFSVDAFKNFYGKHEKYMDENERAVYVSSVLRALSQKTKAEYLEFFSLGVGLKIKMGFPGCLYSYGYFTARLAISIRILVSKLF
jgi:glycosyltransferase involved in cell wall biosynthesis